MEDADLVIRKIEKTVLDRFRNQRLLLKQFGEDGIRVYSALGENRSMGQMLAESRVSEDKFIEILDFMDREGVITTAHAGPGSLRYVPPPPEPKNQPAPERTAEPRAARPAYGGIEPITPFEAPAPSGAEPRPSTAEGKNREPSPPAAGGETGWPGRGERAMEHGALEGQEAEKAGEPGPEGRGEGQAKSGRGQAPAFGEREGRGAIRPGSEEMILPSDFETRKVMPEDMLSPIERMIFDKFGKTGVDVYNLIDGEKTAEEILLETGISESKLVEILEFMDDQGIIKLEKPEQAGRPPEAPQVQREPQEEPAFEPMVEEKPEASLPQTGVKVAPAELPSKTRLGIFRRFAVAANLSVRYPFAGRRLFAEIDGIKDTVQLSKRTRIPFAKMDRILKTLKKREAIEVKPIIEAEVKERYGDEGVSVYRRYGREGLLIYELIGKEASLKDIVVTSSVEPKKGADIIVYIHTMLGIDMPLDKKMLYQQLGVKP
ncbi:MAG: hypothetical protein NT157_02855 [Candidatus Micrarchaeota archaeon]|nr:hypothetical protein [Candidatus Micrarchaeota archaeon]